MSLVPVLERLERLAAEGFDGCLGPGGAVLVLGDVERLERFLASVKVTVATAVEQHAEAGLCGDAGEVIRKTCRTSAGDAARVRRVAEVVGRCSSIAEAFHAGRIGVGHVDAYWAATRTLAEGPSAKLEALLPDLLVDVEWSTPEQFRRRLGAALRAVREACGEPRETQQKADREASWSLDAEGNGKLFARFDPETAERVGAALRAETDARLQADPTLTREQALADALAGLVLGTSRSTRPGLTEMVVFTDLDTYLHGPHAGTVAHFSSGAEVPISTLRRLCCEAHIVPMTLAGDGVPLDVGRGTRLANRAQRRALRKLYGRCAFPGCEVHFDDCHIHHVAFWEHGGHTDLSNLVPLCSKHHHRIHDGGWRLTMDAQRTISIHRPDGQLWVTRCWEPPADEDRHGCRRERRRPPANDIAA